MSHIYKQAELTPERPAIVMSETDLTMSFRELETRSNQAAHALRALGVGHAGHIAILMENRPEFFEVMFAAQRAGIYLTAISRYLGVDEVGYILRDCGAQVFITSPSHAAIAAGACAGLGPDVACFTLDEAVDGFREWEPFRAGFATTRLADEAKGNPMLYSSGTTGRPKGVKRDFVEEPIEGGHPVMELVCLKMAGMNQESVYLSPAPLYHAAPLAASATALMYGTTMVIMQKFTPESFLAAAEKYQATHTQMVPTMFLRMLKLPEEVRRRYDLSNLQCAIHAAAPCPAEVKKQMIDWWGPILLEYYAGSEGDGVTICKSDEALAYPGTVGKSLIGPIHIVGEDGEELPAGEIGDVFFDSGLAFSYHNDPEKTAKAHHPKGWSTLGDVGYLNEDGYLFLTDRRAYTIISGGVNVYPQETEDRLLMHPAVLDAAVFGAPDEDLGEAVKAVVQLITPDAAGPALANELIGWCRATLSGIKCPKSVDFRTEMPRTDTGKLIKRRLKDEYWAADQAAG